MMVFNLDIAIVMTNNRNLLDDKGSQIVRHITADMSVLFEDDLAPIFYDSSSMSNAN